MQTFIAVIVAIFVSLLGLNGASGVGQAQTVAEIQGNLEAVDCQSGTVTLDSSGNAQTIYASDSTAVAVESSSVPFCTLDGYVGAPVSVWVVPYGGEFLATQIDVTGPVPVLTPNQTAIAPMPIVGTVLGTVLAAGLLYLLVHDGAAYYRYPYYGAYYHHYYSARYPPYEGYYPVSAPIISVAEIITGTVLGIVTVDNYEYLAVRDRDGQFRRYPYYGPYRSYYYQPTYRVYSGTYIHTFSGAPVAVGDQHWDAPRYQMQQISRSVTSRPTPWSAPHRALPAPGPQTQPRPTYQRPQPQAQPTYQQPQWQRQAQPTYQRPQPQAQPTYQGPQWQQRAQPTYQRPQPQAQPAYQRPQWQQQAQPAYQRAQPQPQAQPQRGNGGGSRGPGRQQQCDPRSKQGCNTPENK